MNKYNYISILAGGACPNNCPFCIGRGKGQVGTPKFAKYETIIEFLEANTANTDTLSISGHTSDPLFTDFEILYGIVAKAKRLRYNISFHTHNQDQRKLTILEPYIDELCISLNSLDEYKSFSKIVFPIEKIRIASVITEENKDMFSECSLYDMIPVSRFTLRKNVFEPNLIMPFIPGEEKQQLFGIPHKLYNKSSIVVFDCPTVNENITTANLWSDGIVRDQKYWNTLY